MQRKGFPTTAHRAPSFVAARWLHWYRAMIYQPGDYVYPADLPRPMLCRVQEAETAESRAGSGQILTLEPLDGPWPQGTTLIRLDGAVIPAWPRQLRKTTARPGTTAATVMHQPEWPKARRLHVVAA